MRLPGLVWVALPRADHFAHREESVQVLVQARDTIAEHENRVELVGAKALILQVRHLSPAERREWREHAHLYVPVP